MPADCPLCELGRTGLVGCDAPSDAAPIDPGRVALRPSGGERFVMHLGSAAESLLAGLFLLGVGVPAEPAFDDAGFRVARAGWSIPAGAPIDTPTPPPRA